MTKKKHTIKDIAVMAGVSKGTVDRVLHRRGKVSKEAFDKVDKILEEINFKPNPLAQNLKNNRTYTIHVLLPDLAIDAYWAPAHSGIHAAAREFHSFGVFVKKFLYHPHEPASFIKQSQKAISSSPDALVLAPIFLKESEEVLLQCKKAQILAVLFNNPLSASTENIFVGQDLVQSGKVAAGLMDKLIQKKEPITIVHIDLESHMLLKEQGFRSFFEMQGSSEHPIISATFTAAIEEELALFIQQNPICNAFYITNSKAYKVLPLLQNLKKDQATIIGYDLLEQNIQYLKEGKIDFLIHQKPHRQAFLGVAYIAQHFLFGKKLPGQEFLPIDIVTAENTLYYL